MDISAFEDLLALDAQGGFSRAAEARGVTQSTLSRRIAGLESWAGATLVDRTTHRVELTPAGRTLARRAEEALRALQTGREEARDADADARSVLRLACTHMLASTFFPDWLASIEDQLDPAPTIQLTVADMMTCEQRLRRGEVQLLLCHHSDASPAELPSRGFQRIDLADDRLVPVSVSDHGAARFQLGAASEEPLDYLGYRAESGLGRLLKASRVLERLSVDLRSSFHSHAALTLAHLVRSGRGMAWLPLSLVGAELGAGALARAGDETFDVEIRVCLIRPRSRQAPVVEALWRTAAPTL